ncbi:MAG: hypothetical protein DI548_12500 [Flavobacterium johnsoniae]|nr:MAG: hypothetical protein DI548_12500 [Flavobacterium johnsoniae]
MYVGLHDSCVDLGGVLLLGKGTLDTVAAAWSGFLLTLAVLARLLRVLLALRTLVGVRGCAAGS